MRLGIAMGSSIVAPYRKLGRGRCRSKSLPDEQPSVSAGRSGSMVFDLTISGFAVKASREREF
jgi:hypothetical protein